MKLTRRAAFAEGIKLSLAAAAGAVLGNEWLQGRVAQAVSAYYPNQVVPWTDVQTGDPITPGHMNQAYAEIRAVEQGLLNGLSHPLKVTSVITVEG